MVRRADPAEQPRRLERRVRPRHPASRPVSSVPPRRNATASSTSPTSRRPCSPTSVSSAPTTWRGAGWRPATRAARSPARTEFLVNVNEDGLFRDSLIGASMGVVVGVACGLTVLTAVADRWRRRWLPGLLVFVALWLLGYLDATYLAGPVALRSPRRPRRVLGVRHRRGHADRAGVHARHPTAAGRRGPGRPRHRRRAAPRRPRHRRAPRVEHGVRVLADHRHPLRRPGEPDLLAARRGGGPVRGPARRGGCRRGAGCASPSHCSRSPWSSWCVPFWGNDFGAAVSAAPGFALLGWLLLGRELRWRTVWVLVGVLVAAGVLVGLLDLLRPSDERTHVGKFFEKAGTDFGSATLVLRRKASENLSVLPPLVAARLPHRGRAACCSTSGSCRRGRCTRCSSG